MAKNIYITESQFKKIVEENNLLTESKRVVDNFDMVGKMINLTDPDQFFFVQIIKRWKDNKDKGMVKKTDGTYHAGGEMGNFANGTAFKVHSAQELAQLKPQIVAYCDANNARAYVCSNPRSESAINSFLPQHLARAARRNGGVVPGYEKKYGFEHLAGQPKDGPQWTDRPRFFLDVDSTNKNIWQTTKAILAQHNIPIEAEYTTPSGGLHIVIADKYAIQNLDKVVQELRVFDNYKNMGKLQTVHANFDGKIILYSNVDTAGY